MLRALEKYAVRAGGGTNHRMALDDGVLIKDNHIRLAGGVAAALRRAHVAQPELPIQVEVQSLAEVDEALAAGATRLLADNFSDEDLAEVVRRARGPRDRSRCRAAITHRADARHRRQRRRLRLDRRADALRAVRRHQLRVVPDAVVCVAQRRWRGGMPRRLETLPWLSNAYSGRKDTR